MHRISRSTISAGLNGACLRVAVTRSRTMAALFGFFTYATYDLTNWATLKDWPWKLSLIDMAWGTLVSTASAAGGKAALDWATRG